MFDFLFNPKGRISRKGYVVAFLVPYLVVSFVLAPLLGNPGTMLAGLFFLWPKNISVPVRRFHDMGLTGKYQLGFIGLMVLSRIMLIKGIYEAMGGAAAIEDGTIAEQLSTMEKLVMENPNMSIRLGVVMILGVEIAQMLFFGLVKGQDGSNKYGDDPLAEGRGFAD